MMSRSNLTGPQEWAAWDQLACWLLPRRGVVVVRSSVQLVQAAIVLVGMPLAGGPGWAESLQDAWNAALLANQGLQAAQTGTASSQRNVAAARAEWLPTLTTLNAYSWLNHAPTFKSTLPVPGSP